jgi:peptide/nickel transport system permease protein
VSTASTTLAVTVARRPSALGRLLRRLAAALAVAVVSAFVIIAVAAPWLAPFDPIATDFAAVRKAPSALHRLGTDEVGRDVLSRLIWGARASLLAGLIPVTMAVVVSIPLGLVSGYAGGWTDDLIMRLTDAMLAIPFLIVAIALAVSGPEPDQRDDRDRHRGLAGVSPPRAQHRPDRQGRGTSRPRALGGSPFRIGARAILPNMLPPLVIQSSLTVAAAIIAESSLSFLGLGQQPPAPSWGSMLNSAQRYLSQAPWMALYPGLAIFAIVLALNVLGDALRDVLDPKHR